MPPSMPADAPSLPDKLQSVDLGRYEQVGRQTKQTFCCRLHLRMAIYRGRYNGTMQPPRQTSV